MGFMKEQIDSGYGSINKVVCENCVEDYALNQFITDKNSPDTCDYCGETGNCVSVEDLIEKIMDGIRFEYEEALDAIGRDEGEFVGAKTWDTYDLLRDVLSYEMKLNDELLEDIVKTVDQTDWCEQDPYQLCESKENGIMWETFSEMVKTETRYVFFRVLPKNDAQHESPFMILDEIGEKIGDLGLVKTLKSGAQFYRGRMHYEEERIYEPKDLSSPPHEKAKSNRMSAVGISIFYGADSKKTAIAEIYDSKYRFATTAVFKNIHDIQVIDLTEINEMSFPSLFDKDRRFFRQSIAFLREFNKNLTRPIERMEEIEYIPAQIIAEYFRFLYTYNGKGIDGIIYNSSKVENGICYALFFDQKQCISSESKGFSSCHEQKLKIDNNSIDMCEVQIDMNLKKWVF